MFKTTAGRLAINEALPAPLRDYDKEYDKKAYTELLARLAKEYPSEYRDVLWKLTKIAQKAVYWTGAFSFGHQHLATPAKVKALKEELRAKVGAIHQDQRLSTKQKELRILELSSDYQTKIQDAVYEAVKSEDSPLYHQVVSGARGNKTNLASLLGADVLYTDSRDRPIPIPVTRSYSEGLTPAEYYASSFGARKGVTDVKLGVADTGYLAKQAVQATHRLVVTDHDHTNHDPASPRGLPVSTDDRDNVGAALAHDVAGYPRNTILTPAILADLSRKGHDQVLVRSPTVGGPPQGGVYALDVGHRERGSLPAKGEFVGLTAGQALCLAAGTLVRLANGELKRIETIVPGEIVIGVSADTGRATPARVLARYDNGEQVCYETAFRVGNGKNARLSRLISTLDHKALLVTGPASARSTGSFRRTVAPVSLEGHRDKKVAALMPAGYDCSTTTSNDMALAIGLALASNCPTGRRVRLMATRVDAVNSHLASRGLSLRPMSAAGWYTIVSDSCNCPLLAQLKSLVLLGEKPRDKQLPDTSGWDDASVARLFGGMFLAAGRYGLADDDKPVVHIKARSLALLEQLRWLVGLRFGASAGSLHAVQDRSDKTVYRVTFDIRDDVRRLALAVQAFDVPVDFGDAAAGKPRVADTYVTGHCPVVYQRRVGLLPTYDLHIDHPHHLFMLADGLVVSNSEPLTQGGLASKHSGGVAGASKSVSGFKLVDQLLQSPESASTWAAHAQVDGTVSDIRPAPQGGNYVIVDGESHHVRAGQDVKVKKGDVVEAGDVLSDGLPSPEQVIKHKGIGEGRRYLTQALVDAYKGSGMPIHRRNAELVARGFVDHVRLTEEHGGYAPDDVVPYSLLERDWEPRKDHATRSIDDAKGMYLERPVLHYTIGTRLKPKVIEQLRKFGVKQVAVHSQPPPFIAEHVRGLEVLQSDPDWMTRFLGSYVERNLLRGAHRGDVSTENTTSFVPQLARGVGFGQTPYLHSPKVPPLAPNLRRPPDRVSLLSDVLPGSADLKDIADGTAPSQQG